MVLFGLLRRALSDPRLGGRLPAAPLSVAFAAALLWAVHPLNTQSVTYIVQRAQSLMGLCHLVTLYCLLRAATAGPWQLAWYCGAVLACGLGMGCKQDMIVAPITAALFDRIFLAGSWRDAVRARWGLYLALLSTWIVLAPSFNVALGNPTTKASPSSPLVAEPGSAPTVLGAEGTFGSVDVGDEEVHAGFGMKGASPLRYALTQTQVVTHYLRLAIWPRPLCFDYVNWRLARGIADVVPGLIAMAGLGAVTAFALWRWPRVGFLGGWFFLTLAVSSSFIPIADVAFEHRMYLPLIAVVFLVVLMFAQCGVWLAGRWPDLGRVVGLTGWALLVVAAGVLSRETAIRNEVYQSDLALWSNVLSVRPGHWRAHENLGLSLARSGRYTEAVGHLDASIVLRPQSLLCSVRAEFLVRSGRFPDAIEEFRRAVALKLAERPVDGPELRRLRRRLATTLRQSNRWSEAARELRTVLALTPEDSVTRFELGEALGHLGDWAGAAECFEPLLGASSGDTSVLHRYAVATA